MAPPGHRDLDDWTVLEELQQLLVEQWRTQLGKHYECISMGWLDLFGTSSCIRPLQVIKRTVRRSQYDCFLVERFQCGCHISVYEENLEAVEIWVQGGFLTLWSM